MATLRLKLPRTYSLCLSSSERLLATVGGSVIITDIPNRRRVWSAHPMTHAAKVDLSTSEALVAVKSTWGELAVLRAEDGRTLSSWCPKHRDEGASIHFSGDDAYLIDGSWSGDVRVRQISNLVAAETFQFPGQMITSVSRSSSGDRWLFGHVAKHSAVSADPRNPYLTLWEWPLRSPLAEIDTGFKILHAAALAPSATHIAAIGLSGETRASELRILSLSGAVLATAQIPVGGLGTSLSWSYDSKMIGALTPNSVLVFSSPDLALWATLPQEHPSGVAFLRNGRDVLLGSWDAGCGRIAQFPRE